MNNLYIKIINFIKIHNLINIIISNIVRLLLLYIIVVNIYTHYYYNIFIAFVALALTYFPSLLEKKFRRIFT